MKVKSSKVESMLRDAYRQAETPGAVCQKGCSYCCSIPRGSIAEAALMVKGMNKKGIALAPATVAYIHSTHDRLRREICPSIDLSSRESIKRYQSFIEKLSQEIPCPFLESSKACSIYDYRPSFCRLQASTLYGECAPPHPVPVAMRTQEFETRHTQVVFKVCAAELGLMERVIPRIMSGAEVSAETYQSTSALAVLPRFITTRNNRARLLVMGQEVDVE